MERDELLRQVEMEELDEEQRELADVIGLEAYLTLVGAYGGTYVYVPKAETITMRLRDERIRAEFDGGNCAALALKYNLSVSRINDIVSGKRGEIRRRPMDGQVSIFG